MGKTKTALSLLSASPYVVRLFCSLFALWLTLGWRVRKARNAFEKELVKQGMSKEDARKIGARYTILKDELLRGLKHYVRTR